MYWETLGMRRGSSLEAPVAGGAASLLRAARAAYSARVSSTSPHWSADPRLRALQRALTARPALPAPPRDLEAAVALMLRPGDDLDVLLIRRAQHPRDPWSGHVALPGGRRHAEDADLAATARRETREEVGLDLDRVGVYLGGLEPVTPASRRLPSLSVTPFVFGVEPGHELVLDAHEVDAAVWVPLRELRDERAAGEILIEIEGGSHRFPSLTWQDYVVWGLTLRILHHFFEVADR